MSMEAVCNSSDNMQESLARRFVDYEPTAWDTRTFITHSLAVDQKPKEHTDGRITQLKEKVRDIIRETTDTMEIVNLIDTIERLGIGYHFKKEIDDKLCHLNEAEVDNWDLHHVATRFRILRQHQFNASPDIFLKFKDDQGNFDEKISKDPKGLLSLYNAGYLAVPGDEILDDAISFARGHLTSMVDGLRSPLKKQVLRALKVPLHKMLTRVEARYYIEEYGDEIHNEILLELAKLDFNALQSLHLQEMKILHLWWKSLKIEENLTYARERLLECYMIWALGKYVEAEFTRARLMIAKYYALLTVVDDTFDVYGTYEECQLLNEAIQRWEENAVETLPMYMRNMFLHFIRTINSFEDELEPNEKYRMPYIVKWVKMMINGYMQEVEVRFAEHPPSFEERLKVGFDGHTGCLVTGFPFLGAPGDIITKDAFEWLATFPAVAVDCMKIIRFIDDFTTYERESKSGQGPTSFACYMIEHKLTKEETTAKFKSFCEEAWKRVNRACLQPTDGPVPVLERLFNLLRQMETFYVYFDDACNKSSNIKEISTLLLVEPFSL